ncbi:MAG: GPR endopeptidase [Clostridia bacterium]|nr:GPR endopeptidase [Clostridia bacterium]
MDFRTDLALERHEVIKADSPEGVVSETFEKNGITFTKIKVTNESGAESLGKPVGTYITAEIPSLVTRSPVDEEIIEAIGEELRSLLPKEGTVLAVGLGNTDITPDAVGPESISMVLATRHISAELSESVGLGDLRPVAGFTPGVLGKTGVETAESVKGLAETVKPCAVIVVDALAARRLKRLGNTVQMSDTGITPGSGVGNARAAINKESIGVPVISMGIPTVVDAQTLVNDLTDDTKEISREENKRMIITPREIDLVVERASRIIGLSINKALQPHLSVDEVMMLVGN